MKDLIQSLAKAANATTQRDLMERGMQPGNIFVEAARAGDLARIRELAADPDFRPQATYLDRAFNVALRNDDVDILRETLALVEKTGIDCRQDQPIYDAVFHKRILALDFCLDQGLRGGVKEALSYLMLCEDNSGSLDNRSMAANILNNIRNDADLVSMLPVEEAEKLRVKDNAIAEWVCNYVPKKRLFGFGRKRANLNL